MDQKVWLFQSNPNVYDLAKDLKNFQIGDEDEWEAKRYKDQMKPGDKVILWVSGKESGIYALGELTSEPYDNEENETWIAFRYTHILSHPIQRDIIKAHPMLKKMQIIRIPQGTNFRVTEDEWRELQNLIADPSIDTQKFKGEVMREKKLQDIILLDTLFDYFLHQGYSFPPTLLATFITALQTKGFVILSGLSGTGKTKLAQLLTELLPKPQKLSDSTESAIEEDFISLTVTNTLVKHGHFVMPKPFWHLMDVPPEGEKLYITIQFDDQSQECRLAHHSYSTGSYLHLTLKGEARKWVVDNFEAGDTLILQPQRNDDNDFTGFSLSKSHPLPVHKRPALPNHTFVSVRPDWRDNKSLLGFYNPLTGAYDDTRFLRFLLQAKTHYDETGTEALPHFVILDEMNLARPEYYFADFLSTLESGRDDEGYTKETIYLHSQDPEQTFGARGLAIPNNLKLPPNLYVIGTVNMDETTHAFSPKVLDRAFTIEFNDVDFSNYLMNGVAEFTNRQSNQLQVALLSGFQRDGNFARIDKTEIAAILENDAGYQDYLQTLNVLLTTHDLHFGYRVFDEIMQFMVMAEQGELFDELDVAFDVVVLMKVLPKFNGPRNRLRQPLEKVIAWTANPDRPNVETIAPKVKDASACHTLFSQLQEDFYFPETARKALRMLIRLHETGFASFA